MVDGHRTGRTSSTTYGSLAGLAMVTAGWLSLPASVTSSCRCLPALAPSTYPAAPPAAMPKIPPRPVSRQTRFGGLGFAGGEAAWRVGSGVGDPIVDFDAAERLAVVVNERAALPAVGHLWSRKHHGYLQVVLWVIAAAG
jgi:hypothetical protein